MKASSEVQALATFLDRFKAFEKSTQRQRIDTDITGFTRLFRDYAPVEQRLQEILLSTAPRYNIFEVLNIRHYETRVHTPFLAHLLNPNASHEQRRLFFDSFMAMLFGNAYNAALVSNIQVFEEFPCSKGRIDILIRYEAGKQKRAMVVENKIYHHNGPKQLQRYYEYLSGDIRLEEGSYHLVYLTPYKEAPTTYSIEEQEYRKLRASQSLSEIGYHQDIVPWLESASLTVKAPNVKETLLQYIKTIKTL